MIRTSPLSRKGFAQTVSQWLAAFLFLSGCSDAPGEIRNSDPVPVAAKEITAHIDLSKKFQTIRNFAASDAWACQFVGNWPDKKKNAIADLFFSTELEADGQPKGIGLSLWRFNMGAGSTQQGDQSGIKDEWRRAESFLEKDGSYNWQRQAGQVWFLKAAQERGVNQFLAFPNSPPVHLTNNGKAFAVKGEPNLSPAKYDAFADYVADVIQGVERAHGISFNYVSPVNEPQWDWSDGGQEGTPFMNENIAGIVRALNTSLTRRNLATKIDIAEAGKIDYLYQDADKPNRGNQIKAFFHSSSPHYVGDLSHVSKVISGHSYFTTSPVQDAINNRNKLAAEVATVPGLEFWQSEYCILGDNAGEINGNKRGLGIDPAIYLARVIHHDLVVANASAWHWWLAISPYDYKDGLVYVDQNKQDGNYYESKMLWALGNFSRFIRPGAQRVAVQLEGNGLEEKDALLTSSFMAPDQKQLITVAVNPGLAPVKLRLKVKGATVHDMKAYVTSEKGKLTPEASRKNEEELIIAPRSIVTLVTGLQQ